MNKTEEFPFDRARKARFSETRLFRKAYEATFQEKPPRRGRPRKPPAQKYRDIHIKVHPLALLWARNQARKRGVGYQTVINEVLLEKSS